MRRTTTSIAALCFLASVATAPAGQPATSPARELDGRRVLVAEDLAALKWRSVGPANMGGRVASIALCESDPKIWYVGFGTSGLWKTTNRGVTYTPVFDDHDTSSIGAVAVADAPAEWPGWTAVDADAAARGEDPVDRAEAGIGRIVWVGTGEGNGRNSSSWGNGVYRSTDAGATFTHLGLADTHDIPALTVDPRNPDSCLVAALGHLWGPNAERGIFRTTDGGATWEKVLFVNEHIGACDVVRNPANPDEVFAAMYQRRRTPWSFLSGGPADSGAGIYRSRDGGRTWSRLTAGLPAQTGRIGLTVSRANPSIVYATVESDVGGKFGDEWNDRSRAGGVFRSTDSGDTWERRSDFNPRAFYFSRIAADPVDPDKVWLGGWYLYRSTDGGATFHSGSANVAHVDYHAIAIDPADPDHILIGNDGGIYVSWDGGEKWDFHNTMAVGQFYNIAVDDSDPYRIGGGMQDNGSWIGPSASRRRDTGEFMGRAGALTNADWTFVFGGDGYRVQFDPTDPNTIYAEWQGGNAARIHLDTGTWWNIKPAAKEGEPKFRFNWNSPLVLSHHDPTVIYLCGNHVFRLTERGDHWTSISPELSRNEIDRVRSVGSEAETYGTVVSFAESPTNPAILWAGTDDGRIHRTSDTGGAWSDVTPSEVDGRYIAYLTASAHDPNRAYAAIDGHRSDRFDACILATDDAGATWRPIHSDLPPDSPVRVVIEHHRNPDVLFAGNERAAYISIDRGAHWVRLGKDSLPTVPVFDFAIQKRVHDLVAGTHGRSAWILDSIESLASLTPDILQQPLHVFTPRDARPRHFAEYGYLWSDKMFIANNPPAHAIIDYWLRDFAETDVKLSITDPDGHELWSGSGPGKAGLNRVVWDAQPDAPKRLPNPHGRTALVPPGTYTVTVTVGSHSSSAPLIVHAAPE